MSISRSRAARLTPLAACWLSLSCALAAQPQYLDDFPSVARVARDVVGSDERDTAAKRIGAYRQLSRMVRALAGFRALTADETTLMQRYGAAEGAINDPIMSSFDPAQTQRLQARSPRAKWVNLCTLYELDQGLHDELLQTLFTDTFRNAHGAAIGADMRLFVHSPADFEQEDSPVWLQTFEDIPWYKFPAYLLAVLTAISLLLVLRYAAKEMKRHGLDPQDSMRLLAGGRVYELRSVTGLVVGQERADRVYTQSEVRVDAESPGGRTVRAVTHRIKYLIIYVLQPGGEEEAFSLNHLRVQARTGNRFSAVTVRRRGRKRENHLVFYNHDTGVRFFEGRSIRRILRPRFGLIWRLSLAVFFASFYALAAVDYPLNQENYPSLFDYSGAKFSEIGRVLEQWQNAYYGVFVFLLVTFLIWNRAVAALRQSRFEKRGAALLIETLDAAAREQASAGFKYAPAMARAQSAGAVAEAGDGP
jgi:hypothetical protein